MGLAAGCSDVVSGRCSTEAARKAWTVVAGGSAAAPQGHEEDTCSSVTTHQVLPVRQSAQDRQQPQPASLPPSGKPNPATAEKQSTVSRSKRRKNSQGSSSSRASSRGSNADSVESPRSSAASESSILDGADSSYDSSDDEKGAVISQDGVDFVWHGEPLAPLRDLLASGRLRRKHHAALEAELERYDEEALATALAIAHGRQRRLPRGKPPRLLPPRELFWTVKKKPKLKHGALVTDVSTAPSPIRDEWRRTGLRMLATSKVGVILLIPSRGSDGLHIDEETPGHQRLGPASADIGLLSGKSPLRLLVERMRRLQHLAERQQVSSGSRRGGCQLICRIPLYIMADNANKAAVEAYVHEQRHFGIDPSDVNIFAQPLEPVFDLAGHALLSEAWHVGRAPGGSGALFEALQTSGMREDMQKRCLSHVFVMPCDNLLGRVAEPVFLGYASSLGAPCCLKVAVRTEVTDPLGVFCTHHEHHHDPANLPCPRVVEGFELHEHHRHHKGQDGHLRLRVVSLSQYVFSTSLFIGEDGAAPRVLPHAVPTAWPRFDPETMTVNEPKAGELNAIKLECFLSDIFSTLQRKEVPALLVERKGEYAAVPTVQELRSRNGGVHKSAVAMSMLHQSWVAAVGGTFRDGMLGGTHGKDLCEVSPLVSYEGEGLEGYFHGDIDLPLHLTAHGERKAGTKTRMLALVKRPRASIGMGLDAGGDDGFAEVASEGEELPPTPPSEPEEVAVPPAPKLQGVPQSQPQVRKSFSPRRSSPRYDRFSPRYSGVLAGGEAPMEKPVGVETHAEPTLVDKQDSGQSSAQSREASPKQEVEQRPRMRHRTSDCGDRQAIQRPQPRHHTSGWVDQLGGFSPQHSPQRGKGTDNGLNNEASTRRSTSVQSAASRKESFSAKPSVSSSAPQPGAGVWAWIEEELPKTPEVASVEAASVSPAALNGERPSARRQRRSGRKTSSRSRGSSASGDDDRGGMSGRSAGQVSSAGGR